MKESFSAAWRDYKLLLAVGTLYAILCCAQILALGVRLGGLLQWVFDGLALVAVLGGIFVLALTLGVLFMELLRMKPTAEGGWGASLRAAIGRMYHWLKAYTQTPVFANGCLALIVSYHTAFFIFQKSTLRFYHPYIWDPLISALDKTVHFGHYPHDLLLPLLNSGTFDVLLQTAYLGWFFIMYMVLGCAMFCDRNRQRRMTFIWVFGLSWYFLGGFGATLFSSVGPAFYHEYYPALADPYAGLLEYMHKHHDSLIGIILIDAKLVEWNHSVKVVIPNALSAMPSMHGGISWLIFLYARKMGYWLATMALAFFATIFVACVYFGFHYAVDLYAGALAVTLLWWAASCHVKYHLAREAA